MSKIYLDAETCGLHGVPVILQYAEDRDGPVKIHNFWTNTFRESLNLIEWIVQQDIIGFNLSFDFFHLYKIHTMFQMFVDQNPDEEDSYPDGFIEQLAIIEERARFSDYCLKPKSAVDLMLIARRGKYQTLMERDPIIIRKIPTGLAYNLASELERRVPFDDIYFAKAKDKFAPRWKVYDIKRQDGTIDPNFKTIKLIFKASGALKVLYRHAFNVTEKIFTYRDVEVDRKYWPKEVGYAPFALAIGKPGDWNWSWPEVIKEHISHWEYNSDARTYAANDVIYTRRLYYEHFNEPEPNVDSTLTCLVAVCRWSGYAIDIPKLKGLKEQALLKLGFDPESAAIFKDRPVTQQTINRIGNAIIDTRPSRRYIMEVLSPEEKLGMKGSTKRAILEEIVKWMGDDGKMHPAAIRARRILDCRIAKKEIEIYDKLIQAGRFHASFKVMGALSNRMSGADDLNPQGIKHQTYVRECFPLADNNSDLMRQMCPWKSETEIQEIYTALCGGDFKSFEISIAAKVFNDPKFDEILRSDKKIHAIFATHLFPAMTYEEICKSEGQDPDYYDRGKKGLFSFCYGGTDHTLVTRLNADPKDALDSIIWLKREFPGIAREEKIIKNDFGALSQPKGIGTKVEWHDPKQYVESFLGFKRYFTLEIRVAKALFELAQDIPQEWKSIKIKVLRRDRLQTAHGALASALYGAAFGICSRMMRAATNHKIQSPGAEITKATQAHIWELQPVGKSPWIVKPMNIHDELMTPTKPGFEEQVEQKAQEAVALYRKQVPLLRIDWFTDIENWADKKGKSKIKG